MKQDNPIRLAGESIGGGVKFLAAATGIVLVTVAIVWLIAANNLALFRVFAPAEESVRRHTFEQSRAFNEGMAQELYAMEFDYLKADADGKASIRSIILHRTADYDIDRLPADLRGFIEQLKSKATP